MNEEILRLALIEADECILSQLPSKKSYEHDFSHPFVRKLQKLIRREKHPLFYKIRRIAAAVLIFFTLSAGVLLAANGNVRAYMLHWIVKSAHNDSGRDSYWYEANSDLHRNVSDYTLEGLVPERYSLAERLDKETFVSEDYIDTNQSNFPLLSFGAVSPGSDWDLGLFPNEHTAIIPVRIGEADGTLYLSDLEGDPNAIVWQNRDGILFFITGPLTKEELLDLSRKIE